MDTPRSFTRVAAPVVLAALIGLGLTACSSSGNKTATTSPPANTPTTASSSPSAPAANATTIAIQGFMFKPSPAHVKVGSTVTVTNGDSTDHSLTANDGSFDTGVYSSGSKTITLSKAGTFAVHCKIHNFMTGSIQVGS